MIKDGFKTNWVLNILMIDYHSINENEIKRNSGKLRVKDMLVKDDSTLGNREPER